MLTHCNTCLQRASWRQRAQTSDAEADAIVPPSLHPLSHYSICEKECEIERLMAYSLLGYKPIKQNTELVESNVIMDTKGKILLPTTDMVKVPRQYSQLVSWCFEPSQPQRITSGLNTNFTLSPSYPFHKSFYSSHVVVVCLLLLLF